MGPSMPERSFRTRLRAFRDMRGEPPDRGFIADLEYLENRDLDLSVRIGALLAFNALAVMVGTYPVSSSPGAPLSLDAKAQSVLTVLSLVGVAPFMASSYLSLKALLLGEEFDGVLDAQGDGLRHHLFAAFVHSLDTQSRLLRSGVRWTLSGGVLTFAVWVSILAGKMA